MRGAVYLGPGELELQEIPDPHAGPGDILLRTGANTVCGTDVRILRGEKSAGIDVGVVLGHEISGHVVEVGAGVTGFSEGDLVGLDPTVSCGVCPYCVANLEQLCIDPRIFGYRLNGGLADYVLVPETAVRRGAAFVADPALSPAEVALAEPLGCVLNGARNYRPGIGTTVVIMGAGPIGLLHTQINRLAGASRIIVSDVSATRADVARQFGATDVVNPAETDIAEYCRDVTDGLGADIAVVCVGRPGLVNDALRAVRKRGRVSAFAGFPKGDAGLASIDPNLIHYGEIEVYGASNAARQQHQQALDLIASGAVDVKSLVTNTFPLADVMAAIEFSASGAGIKVAVVPQTD
ncbi:MAG: alcohol dehydrogenase catalytic domain-containing protein [Acidipropionibacterium acidipropionici]|jgi:L-iditol 2-dehydrogenase|uniref:zinc-binding dehydrogenase n=1 Tax=Acidipropionibacterium acidipropionici TaxID=1748 RepID=UPI000564308A|nr:alcohol dehydrogenase catalytic domain-containing protein [Acidipropionibacterium acidipropionici]ALN14964.1 alcohol dehydrogenase [Acidipropionibacterium acidipropionici]APZ09285.1 alcohol dehydrogenase [Acidipropionibacterium acidipropionici]